jgi:hypothetical protein
VASASSIAHDGVVSYTTIVRNAGPATTPARVTTGIFSFLGTTATVQSASLGIAPISCPQGVCQIPSMAPGAAHTLIVNYKFDAPGTHQTTAMLGSEPISVSFEVASSAVPALPEPTLVAQANNRVFATTSVAFEPTSVALSISGLSVAQTSVPDLGIANFSMTVRNGGPLPTPVSLTASVQGSGFLGTPKGVIVFTTIGTAQVPCSTVTNVCSLPSLAPGQSVVVSLAMRIEGAPESMDLFAFAVSDPGTVSFTVASSASPPLPETPLFGFPGTIDNTASTPLGMGLKPVWADLSIQNLTASAASTPHDGTVTYSMNLRNRGKRSTPVALTADAIDFALSPASGAIVSATFGGSSHTCTATKCTLPTIDGGQSVPVTVTMRFAGAPLEPLALPDHLVQVAFEVASRADPPIPEPTMGDFDNRASVTTRVGKKPVTADLSVTDLVSSSGFVPHGGTAAFTMTVRNAGPLGTRVRLTTAFANVGSGAGAELVDATIDGVAVRCATEACDLGSFPSGRTATLVVTMRFAGVYNPGLSQPSGGTMYFSIVSSATPPVPQSWVSGLDDSVSTPVGVGPKPAQTPA